MQIEDKIKEIENEIRITPYHKGTEHYIGRLRARLAQLKDEQLNRISRKSGGGTGFAQKKSGDATVVLVGPPSVGKSSLINVLTEANSKVAEYDFTTLEVIPGMMEYQSAKIQIFDLPGIIKGASLGKGRGKEVLSVARSADLLLLMVDVSSIHLIESLKKELYQFGLRLDQLPPKIAIHKKTKGGIKITSTTPLSQISRETIKEIAGQFKYHNAEINIKEDVSLDRLIDVFMSNRVYLPYLVVVNKADLTNNQRNGDYLFISVKEKSGLDELKQAIWNILDLIKIFLRHDHQTDYDKPLIVKNETSVLQVAQKISLEMANEVKSAKVWGKSVKFSGQTVSLNHKLVDGDILFLVK